MKDLILDLLERQRKKKVELIDFFGITRAGLDYKLKEDAWKVDELEKLADFFNVEVNYFLNYRKNMYSETVHRESPGLWESLVKEKDMRIEELMSSLNDARYTIQLQKKLMSIGSNFNTVSKESPVSDTILGIIYGGRFDLKTA